MDGTPVLCGITTALRVQWLGLQSMHLGQRLRLYIYIGLIKAPICLAIYCLQTSVMAKGLKERRSCCESNPGPWLTVPVLVLCHRATTLATTTPLSCPYVACSSSLGLFLIIMEAM